MLEYIFECISKKIINTILPKLLIIVGILTIIFVIVKVTGLLSRKSKNSTKKITIIAYTIIVILALSLFQFGMYTLTSLKDWIIKNYVLSIGLSISVISVTTLIKSLLRKKENPKQSFRGKIIFLFIGLIITAIGLFLSLSDKANGFLFLNSKSEDMTEFEYESDNKYLNTCFGEQYDISILVRGNKLTFSSGESYDEMEDVKKKIETITDCKVVLIDDYASAFSFEEVKKILEAEEVEFTVKQGGVE